MKKSFNTAVIGARLAPVLLLCLVALGCASQPTVSDRSDARAIDQLMRAAEAGDPEAQSELAFAYQTGRGVPADQEAGVEWHSKAAKQGVMASKAALGRCLLKGAGTKSQPIRAASVLREAALAGEPNAQALLGSASVRSKAVMRGPTGDT